MKFIFDTKSLMGLYFAGINGVETSFTKILDETVKVNDIYHEAKLCGMTWLFYNDCQSLADNVLVRKYYDTKGTQLYLHNALRKICFNRDFNDLKYFMDGYCQYNQQYILTVTNVIDNGNLCSIFRVSFPTMQFMNDIIIVDTVEIESYENVNIGYLLDNGKVWSCLCK